MAEIFPWPAEQMHACLGGVREWGVGATGPWGGRRREAFEVFPASPPSKRHWPSVIAAQLSAFRGTGQHMVKEHSLALLMFATSWFC